MRRRFGLAAALLAAAALAPGVARGQTLTALPFRSGESVIDVRATTVNDFQVRAPIARAQFSGTALSSVTGFLEVRVADMRTGIGLRDRHLRETMHADSFPVIRFELIGVDAQAPAGDTVNVVYQGRIVLHGVTKGLRIPGQVIITPRRIDVIIRRFQLNLPEYNIVPPSRFLGGVRVQNDIHVNLRMTFGQ